LIEGAKLTVFVGIKKHTFASTRKKVEKYLMFFSFLFIFAKHLKHSKNGKESFNTFRLGS